MLTRSSTTASTWAHRAARVLPSRERMSSTSSSSPSSDGEGLSVKLDDRVLVRLLRSLAALYSLEDSVLHLITSYVPTRRYAPMPDAMPEPSPPIPKALPLGPKAPPLHLH